MAKTTVEIGQVVETAIEGDVADTPLPRLRQRFRRSAKAKWEPVRVKKTRQQKGRTFHHVNLLASSAAGRKVRRFFG
jgi:hypothetical protein